MIDISVNYLRKDAYRVLGEILKEVIDYKTIIVCIGIDLHIIDSIGPLLGTLLEERNVNIPVIGTLNSPIHALNIESKKREINSQYSGYKVIAVEGCHSDEDDIGNIRIKSGGIKAGDGGEKAKCTEIGDISIMAIVEGKKYADQLTEREFRMRYAYDMARVIRNAITYACNKREDSLEIIHELKNIVESLSFQVLEIKKVLNKVQNLGTGSINQVSDINQRNINNRLLQNKAEQQQMTKRVKTKIPNFKTKSEILYEEVLRKIGKL